MIDPVGQFIIELRDDPAVAAIVDERVASPEPLPGWSTGKGYQAFIVIVALVLQRHPSVPIQRDRYAVRCYGRDQLEAAHLYGAASDVFHHKPPRMTTGGYGIYVSHDDTGGEPERDPVTKQPYYTFVMEAVATTVPA